MERPYRMIPVRIAALAIVASAMGCGSDNTYAPPPPPKVTVAYPVQETVIDWAEFPGTIETPDTSEVRARVVGYLQEIHYDVSVEQQQFVEKGQLLFTIEPDTYQQAYDAAKAKVQQAIADRDLADATLKRLEKALETNAVSKLEVIEARAKFARSKAEVLAAEAERETAKLNLSYTQIKAPISGRINDTPITVGDLVGQGEATLLTTIVAMEPMYAWFNPSERDVLSYRIRRQTEAAEQDREAEQVRIILANGDLYDEVGLIDYADNAIDPATGTLRVRAVFANPNKLLVPGLYVRVRIPRSIEGSLLVPDTAVQRDLVGYYLLVVNDQNTVDRHNVKVGTVVDGQRVVQGGLALTDRIIVNGLQRARPGAAVDPQPAQAAKPSDTHNQPAP